MPGGPSAGLGRDVRDRDGEVVKQGRRPPGRAATRSSTSADCSGGFPVRHGKVAQLHADLVVLWPQHAILDRKFLPRSGEPAATAPGFSTHAMKKPHSLLEWG